MIHSNQEFVSPQAVGVFRLLTSPEEICHDASHHRLVILTVCNYVRCPMRIAIVAFASLALLFSIPAITAAQTGEKGMIVGEVKDPSGAIMPGVSISIASKEEGHEVHGITDNEGKFAFNLLRPGTYTLTAHAQGFSTMTKVIHLMSYQRLDISITLQVGVPETVVSVTELSNAVDTASATVRDTLPGSAIKEMPIIMDDYNTRGVLAQMQFLLPGASSFSYQGGAAEDTLGSMLTINGSALGGVGFYVDGVDNNGLLGYGAATIGPNPDALEEMSVLSQSYKAESGGHQAEVQLRTRSGGNQFHGQARIVSLNRGLSARDFFATQSGSEYKTNAAGFQLSGPLKIPGVYDGHNRTFWLFDNEWIRTRQSTPQVYTFPSDAFRSGDFSSLPTRSWPKVPSTSQSFPGGKIPSESILPQARFYIDEFIPHNDASGNATIATENHASGYQYTIHLDHHIGSSDSLNGSMFSYWNTGVSSGGSTIGNLAKTSDHGYNLSLQYVHNLSAQATNVLSFGNTLWRDDSITTGKFTNVDLTKQGYNIHNITAGPRGYPTVYTGGSGGYFTPDGSLSVWDQTTFQWKDDFSLIRRSHAWKFGADLRWSIGVDQTQGSAPRFNFSGSATGNAFADFLLGLPYSYSQGSDSEVRPSRILMSLYAQDDFRLTPDLTLNLGLRYELNGAPRDRNGHNAGFRPGIQSTVFPNAPAGILFPGDFDPLQGRVMDAALAPANRANFAPRFGLAWSPHPENKFAAHLLGGPGHFSLRAAYGIYRIVNPVNQGVAIIQPWNFSVSRGSATISRSGGNMANPWGTDPDPFAQTAGQRSFYIPMGGVSYVEPWLRSPYQHQWTLSIERQLPAQILLQVAYVGNRTLHLLRIFEANQGKLVPGANTGNVDSRRTYANFGGVVGYASDGTSVYNGLQVTASRRLSSQLLFNLDYVWSRTLDNASGVFSPYDPADRAVTPWGRANSDRTHNFVAFWVVDLPGLSSLRMLTPVVSGWRLSGNVQLRTGMPLQIRSYIDSTLLGTAPGMPDIIGTFSSFNPREIHKFKLPNGQTTSGNFFFDPSVFKIVDPASPAEARPGNLGRNVFDGPLTANVDLSLQKDFSIQERHKVAVRIDATNALNHAQFWMSPYNLSIASPGFGKASGTTGPRKVQFQLRYSF
jgi:hypothetical protein